MTHLLQSVVGASISLLLLALGTLLSRRFAAASQSGMMTLEEVMASGQRLSQLERKATLAGIVTIWALTYPLAYLLHMLNTRLLSPAVNPAYDGRRMEWWLLSGLTLGAAAGMPVVRAVARWLWACDPDLVDRYVATLHGVNFRRANFVWATIFIVLAIVAGYAAWNNGIVIDERGVTVRLGWFYSHRTFQDVESVERSISMTQSNDQKGRQIVRIRFRVGKPGTLTLDENEKQRCPADLDRIEAYVRQRMTAGP